MPKTNNLNSLSQIIKDEIDKYDHKVDSTDVGQVVSVGDCIATVFGLDDAMYGELIEFPGNAYGMVMNIEETDIGVALFGENITIKEGDPCKRTKRLVSVPVGDALLGRVVNALGQPIDGYGKIETKELRPIEVVAPEIMDRQSVCEPLETGVKAIDSMIPIGKGQRELIIGDRQTGKTAIAIDTIINQKGKDVYCVYCSIGQKNSSLAQIVARLKRFDALKYTTIVGSSAAEPSPMQYLAPYSATSIAEHWMHQGKNVLIIYDDLSKHAVAYRTLLLLLRRSPGREAYPGDIFYLHSRLLERSCRLSDELGGGSLTALPIIETQAGDISAYIPTNVISITDGQIFLNSDSFYSGIRPAIDAGTSVSRVGGAAQIKAMKKVAGTLRLDLASYRELESFAQFGSDLDEATQGKLNRGRRTVEVLKQPLHKPLPVEKQVVILYALTHGFLDTVAVDDILPFQDQLFDFFDANHQDLLAEIKTSGQLPDTAKLDAAIKDFAQTFQASAK